MLPFSLTSRQDYVPFANQVTCLEEVGIVIADSKVCKGTQGNNDERCIQRIGHPIQGETLYLLNLLFSFNKIKNIFCSRLALSTIIVRWECSHNSHWPTKWVRQAPFGKHMPPNVHMHISHHRKREERDCWLSDQKLLKT